MTVCALEAVLDNMVAAPVSAADYRSPCLVSCSVSTAGQSGALVSNGQPRAGLSRTPVIDLRDPAANFDFGGSLCSLCRS